MPAGPIITSYIGAKEGKVLKAYLDHVHVLTIGYGATWASKAFQRWWAANRSGKFALGATVSEAEALTILRLMLDEEYCPPVDAKFANVKQNVRDAGYSAVLNLGPGSLGWQWAQKIAAGMITEGAALWRRMGTTAKGKTLTGLVIRRREEADLAEFNRYPAWFKFSAGVNVAPETHMDAADIRQAQVWLEALGYAPGPADGVPGQRTIAATLRFQKDHGQLTEDGIIGHATLAALKRTIDLRNKTAVVVGSSTVAVGGGVTENTTNVGADVPVPAVHDLGWIGDVLLYGGIAVAVVGVVWLAWRYKDEIKAVLRRLA